MSYHIEQKASFKIMGIALKTDNQQAPITVPRFWEKFYSENILEKIPNKCTPAIFGLYTDYEGDYTDPYTLVIGCQVTDGPHVPKGMVIKEVPEATYAVYTTQGEFPHSLIETWEEIWKSDLSRAYTEDFEVYGKRFDNGEIDVYVAIASFDKQNAAAIGR